MSVDARVFAAHSNLPAPVGDVPDTVRRYLQHYGDEPPPPMPAPARSPLPLTPWDAQYIAVPANELFETLNVATRLQMTSLSSLCAAAISVRLRQKPCEVEVFLGVGLDEASHSLFA